MKEAVCLTVAEPAPSLLRRFLLVGTKFLPVTGNPLLDFLRGDYYYPLLVPMTVTVTLVGVYLNWLAMKFFRHN